MTATNRKTKHCRKIAANGGRKRWKGWSKLRRKREMSRVANIRWGRKG